MAVKSNGSDDTFFFPFSGDSQEPQTTAMPREIPHHKHFAEEKGATKVYIPPKWHRDREQGKTIQEEDTTGYRGFKINAADVAIEKEMILREFERKKALAEGGGSVQRAVKSELGPSPGHYSDQTSIPVLAPGQYHKQHQQHVAHVNLKVDTSGYSNLPTYPPDPQTAYYTAVSPEYGYASRAHEFEETARDFPAEYGYSEYDQYDAVQYDQNGYEYDQYTDRYVHEHQHTQPVHYKGDFQEYPLPTQQYPLSFDELDVPERAIEHVSEPIVSRTDPMMSSGMPSGYLSTHSSRLASPTPNMRPVSRGVSSPSPWDLSSDDDDDGWSAHVSPADAPPSSHYHTAASPSPVKHPWNLSSDDDSDSGSENLTSDEQDQSFIHHTVSESYSQVPSSPRDAQRGYSSGGSSGSSSRHSTESPSRQNTPSRFAIPSRQATPSITGLPLPRPTTPSLTPSLMAPSLMTPSRSPTPESPHLALYGKRVASAELDELTSAFGKVAVSPTKPAATTVKQSLVKVTPSAPPAPSYLSQSVYQRSRPTCIMCDDHVAMNERIVQTHSASGEPAIYHLRCFRCCVCNDSLEHMEHYIDPHSDLLFCHVDYHETFSPKCGQCHSAIEGKYIEAMGATYHVDHFFCAGCGSPFRQDQPHHVLEDHAWCDSCHDNKTQEKCWRCSHVFKSQDPIIEVLDRLWCETCYCCEECSVPLKEEFTLTDDGVVLCEPCQTRRVKKYAWQ